MSEAERVEWETRHRERGAGLSEPEPFILSSVSRLGPPGTACDLAGGTGRHTLWLAAQGWATTLIDIAPSALEVAAALAKESGLAISTAEHDLDAGMPSTGPFDLAVIHHYLNRRLLSEVESILAPGGHLVMAHPTLINLERHDRPSRRYLLEPGELPSLLSSLEIASYFEGWTTQGRHEARVVAWRPQSNGAGL